MLSDPDTIPDIYDVYPVFYYEVYPDDSFLCCKFITGILECSFNKG